MAVIILHHRASECTWQRDCQADGFVDVIKVYNPVRQAKDTTLRMVGSQLSWQDPERFDQYGLLHAICVGLGSVGPTESLPSVTGLSLRSCRLL